jgi:DNA-binding NarL/FixJ family response regulator
MKILLADDHKMFSDGISHLIRQQDWEVIGIAQTGREIFTIIEKQGLPDIVVIDIEMPDMDGVESTKQLRAVYPDLKILVLSMHRENEFIRQMLKMGIDGYILKDDDQEELIRAIHSIVKGERYFGTRVAESFISKFGSKKPQQTLLSKREIDIIQLIAEEKTTSEIAEKLFLSKHTVETHRKNILLKLGLKNSVGLIRYAIQKGIIQ